LRIQGKGRTYSAFSGSDSRSVHFAEELEDELNADDPDHLDDPDGTCHHHQSADEEVYDKYSEVISELSATFEDEGEEEEEDEDPEGQEEDADADEQEGSVGQEEDEDLDEEEDGNGQWTDADDENEHFPEGEEDEEGGDTEEENEEHSREDEDGETSAESDAEDAEPEFEDGEGKILVSPDAPHCCTTRRHRSRQQDPLQSLDQGPRNRLKHVEAWVEQTSRRSCDNLREDATVAERVADLDVFYSGLPYPPHTNIHKS
jgi:hypothetical protein